MKIQICRESGYPVDMADINAFKEAYGLLYDKVHAHVKPGKTGFMTEEEALRMNKLLERLRRKLLAQYPVIKTIEITGSPKSWVLLTRQYGPVALAESQVKGKLAAIILDNTVF